MSEMIGAELCLEAIQCGALWAGHDAGVRDDDVEWSAIGQ
jgi:hypothetical protein